MKKLLLLLILNCVALAAEQLHLDTKFIDKAGTAASLYEQPQPGSHADGLEHRVR